MQRWEAHGNIAPGGIEIKAHRERLFLSTIYIYIHLLHIIIFILFYIPYYIIPHLIVFIQIYTYIRIHPLGQACFLKGVHLGLALWSIARKWQKRMARFLCRWGEKPILQMGQAACEWKAIELFRSCDTVTNDRKVWKWNELWRAATWDLLMRGIDQFLTRTSQKNKTPWTNLCWSCLAPAVAFFRVPFGTCWRQVYHQVPFRLARGEGSVRSERAGRNLIPGRRVEVLREPDNGILRLWLNLSQIYPLAMTNSSPWLSHGP